MAYPPCTDCLSPHCLDTSIPSDIWNQIAEHDERLCTRCIDQRLVERGLTAEAEFYFVGEALRGKLYAAGYGEIARLREELATKVLGPAAVETEAKA